MKNNIKFYLSLIIALNLFMVGHAQKYSYSFGYGKDLLDNFKTNNTLNVHINKTLNNSFGFGIKFSYRFSEYLNLDNSDSIKYYAFFINYLSSINDQNALNELKNGNITLTSRDELIESFLIAPYAFYNLKFGRFLFSPYAGLGVSLNNDRLFTQFYYIKIQNENEGVHLVTAYKKGVSINAIGGFSLNLSLYNKSFIGINTYADLDFFMGGFNLITTLNLGISI